MTELNEIVASNLRTAIDRIEGTLRSGAKLENEFLLKGELLNKLGQLAEVKQQQEFIEKDKKDDKVRETAAISYLVAKETKLNAQEKEEYAQFLSKEYFRKSDLKELEGFYTNSWDKLSEEGKEQMTQRVAEGIRRGEFTYDQMPDSMKKREVDRLKEYGVEVTDRASNKNPDNPAQTSQYIGKSASFKEADSSKENKSGEKSSVHARESEKAVDQPLAFEDKPAPLKPSELPQVGGSVRSPS